MTRSGDDLGRIGPYRLQCELGRGGQGVVYFAVHEKLGRRVALKVLGARDVGSRTQLLRFRRESEATARIEHPALCHVYEAGVHEGVPWIAMRYVEGQPFTASDTRRERATVLRILEQVARALHVAHGAGVVHRDVKPGNIVVQENGEPVVVDFGLAAVRHDAGLTAAGDVIGTPGYMSPEQIDATRGPVGPSTDVWALGVVLFEGLTGRRPFRGDHRAAVYREILEGEPEWRCARKLPRSLRRIIETALAKDSRQRYASMLDLARDLRCAREGRPVAARPVPMPARWARWFRRYPIPGATIVLVCAVLVASILWTSGSNRDRRALNASLRKEQGETARELEARRTFADARALEELLERAEDLLPATAALIPEIETWLDDVTAGCARGAGHRRRLRALRSEARPYSERQRRRDYRDVYDTFRMAEHVRDRLRVADESDALSRRDERRLEHLEASVDRLRARTRVPRSWSFATFDEAYREHALSRIVSCLDRLEGEGGLVAEVRDRLAVARRERIHVPSDLEARWGALRERLGANPRYAPALAPRINARPGFIPVGPDPRSGLEELLVAALHRGPVPERAADGRLRFAADTGLVMVLVPGGTFGMGSQLEDLSAPGYDPRTRWIEEPHHPVRLAPFYLSKYEVTQAQWLRLTGGNPSQHVPERAKGNPLGFTPTHPVERVLWSEAADALRRVGLLLPTEAQWERAYRAGTSTVFPRGPTIRSLRGHANVGGVEYEESGLGHAHPASKGWRDPFALTNRVGELLPNALGLHDVAGNVREWCRDPFVAYRNSIVRPVDGLRSAGTSKRIGVRGAHRVVRGSSYRTLPFLARSMMRWSEPENARLRDVGLRPSAAVWPDSPPR